MSQAVEVTTANFETEVIAASMQTPVLVDFWAPWCAPCRSLGPILDKLAVELAGQVKVVKVNTDEEQQLAGVFGIRSLPTVMLLRDGQPVDGFMGAQPESVIRQWLQPHLGELPETGDEADEVAEASPSPALAPEQHLDEARQQLAAEPDKAEHQHTLIEALLENDLLDEAQTRLSGLPAAEAESERARRARAELEFRRTASDAPTIAELDQRLQRNPDDHAARHLLGVRLLLDGEHPAALDAFLEIMRRDRSHGDDLGRKSLVQAFALVPDAALVGRVRRQMSTLLF